MGRKWRPGRTGGLHRLAKLQDHRLPFDCAAKFACSYAINKVVVITVRHHFFTANNAMAYKQTEWCLIWMLHNCSALAVFGQ